MAGDESVASILRRLPDMDIRRPLWEWRPADVKAVMHERRVRFGSDEETEEWVLN